LYITDDNLSHTKKITVFITAEESTYYTYLHFLAWTFIFSVIIYAFKMTQAGQKENPGLQNRIKQAAHSTQI